MGNPIFWQAFMMGIGLIMAIGAQNIYIIKVGLSGRNVFFAATLASVCDTILILLGTFFMATLMAKIPGFVSVAKWGGCAFLGYYGLMSLKNALAKSPQGWVSAEAAMQARLAGAGRRGGLLWSGLAFSLLNPHVYLDTFLILGNLGSRLSGTDQWWFIAGAGASSFVWFYATGLASKSAARYFQNPRVTRVFDFVVALVMWGIAYGLWHLDVV
ncbi:MAG: LysE family transporter [Neisseriaceae bacterium]|nr:LysE family transporter [Neisseriaceae bacterium]